MYDLLKEEPMEVEEEEEPMEQEQPMEGRRRSSWTNSRHRQWQHVKEGHHTRQ